MNNKSIPFIVEDGFNTSYIDALCVALYYKPSYIQNMLAEYPVNIHFASLQEIIYEDFVCNMRSHNAIDSSIINNIRNEMIACGWKENMNIVELYNVCELYLFLIKGFCESNMICKINENVVNFDLIELTINNKYDDIKSLLCEWEKNNLPKFTFEKAPLYIPISIHRTHANQSFLDIKEAIKFNNNTDSTQENIIWTIHSLICYSTGGEGHYYSIVNDCGSWYMFTNKKIPSLMKVDIKDTDISTKIKQECVFILYTINKSKFDDAK